MTRLMEDLSARINGIRCASGNICKSKEKKRKMTRNASPLLQFLLLLLTILFSLIDTSVATNEFNGKYVSVFCGKRGNNTISKLNYKSIINF